MQQLVRRAMEVCPVAISVGSIDVFQLRSGLLVCNTTTHHNYNLSSVDTCRLASAVARQEYAAGRVLQHVQGICTEMHCVALMDTHLPICIFDCAWHQHMAQSGIQICE